MDTLTLSLWALILGSSIWAAVDARRYQISSSKKPYSFNNGAFAWFLVCVLFWIVGFPYYLITRYRTLTKRGKSAGSVPLFECPLCEREMQLPSDALGTIVSCPYCEKEVRLPAEMPALQRSANPLYMTIGGLCIFGLVCSIIILSLTGTLKVSTAELQQEVEKTIIDEYEKDATLKGIKIVSFMLTHIHGNQYEGLLETNFHGYSEKSVIDVTYDGKAFLLNPRSERHSVGMLQKILEIEIKKALFDDSDEMTFESFSLIHKAGNDYEGLVSYSKGGKGASIRLDVVYDGENLSWQAREEDLRLSVEELSEKVKDSIVDTLSDSSEAIDGSITNLSLTEIGEGIYEGVLTGNDAGEEWSVNVDVKYDGETFSWEFREDDMRLSVKDLQASVLDSISEEWAKIDMELPKAIRGFTLIHKKDNEYRGILTVEHGGKEASIKVEVIYDGENMMWEIQK